MSRVEIKLDDELFTLIDERAAASGKPRDEVIAEAVRRQTLARSAGADALVSGDADVTGLDLPDVPVLTLGNCCSASPPNWTSRPRRRPRSS